ncbi:MAG TPA: hypothetical protein VGL89_17415 [Candidatus Koribacter sp.]
MARRILLLVALLAVLFTALSPTSAIVWALVAPVLFFFALIQLTRDRETLALAPVRSAPRTSLPSRAPPAF